MNAMEKTVDLLLCIGILFLMPLLYFDSQKCALQAVLIGQIADEFLDEVSEEGKITMHSWEAFQRSLRDLRCLHYEIKRDCYLYEPGEDGEVLETVHRLETTDIVENLEAEGVLRLRKGDMVHLLLYCGEIPTMYSTEVRTGGVFR